jgi:hypothetical protein
MCTPPLSALTPQVMALLLKCDAFGGSDFVRTRRRKCVAHLQGLLDMGEAEMRRRFD